MTIWAEIDNTDPLVSSIDFPSILTFDVRMYDSYCLDGQLTVPTLRDVLFAVEIPVSSMPEVMDPWTHSLTANPVTVGREDCTERVYTFSGPCADKGLVSIDASTREISVTTTSSRDVGTWSCTITTEIANHPFLVPLLTVSSSFNVIIDSPCENAVFMENLSITNKMHYVGEEPLVWRFDEWWDDISFAIS